MSNKAMDSLVTRVANQIATPQVKVFRQTMLGIYTAHRNSLVSKLGSEAEAKSLFSSVLIYADKNPALMKCTPQSIWECIANSVSSGFWPVGFPPMAYYIPYKDTAVFVPHYNAYVTKMFQTGHVKKIVCKVVREADEFEYIEGSDERIIHKTFRGAEKDRGKRIGVYCITKNQFGEEQITFLSAAQIDGIKSKSRARDTGPWSSKIDLEVDWMWMKSAVRQHWKLLPHANVDLPDFEDERDAQAKGVGLADVDLFSDDATIIEMEPANVVEAAPVVEKVDKVDRFEKPHVAPKSSFRNDEDDVEFSF